MLIAREKGARVAYRSWHGFGEQKNYALSLANGYVIAGEILGAVLLLWQWRAGVFEGLTRRARAEKAASGSTPSSP